MADPQKAPIEPAIGMDNLHKTYGDKEGVDAVTFNVAQGKTFRILGPNGAGASTTLELIVDLRDPDPGETSAIAVDGPNTRNCKARDGPEPIREPGSVRQTLSDAD